MAKNILRELRLDKSSDDFINILRMTREDITYKSKPQLSKIYADLVDLYDNEPTPFSGNQIRVIEAITSLGSIIWMELTKRNYDMSTLVDCVADIQVLDECTMTYISNSQDVKDMLNHVGLEEHSDIGAVYITEKDGEIIHMFSTFETVGYLSERLTPLVINGNLTKQAQDYKEEENE